MDGRRIGTTRYVRRPQGNSESRTKRSKNPVLRDRQRNRATARRSDRTIGFVYCFQYAVRYDTEAVELRKKRDAEAAHFVSGRGQGHIHRGDVEIRLAWRNALNRRDDSFLQLGNIEIGNLSLRQLLSYDEVTVRNTSGQRQATQKDISNTMQIVNLEIQNFRAIEEVQIDGRSTMIVIAGPNGCGKSCVLDGIRFIKSAYGGYGPNEWDQWLGEFQINRQQDPWEMRKILRNKAQRARIAITLRLHPGECQHIQENEQEIAEEIALNQISPGIKYSDWRQRIRISGEVGQAFLQQVERLTSQLVVALKSQMRKAEHNGAVAIEPNGRVVIERNLVLESIWKIYEPQRVGLVDYHGSHRHYAREQIGGVNLNLKTQEEQQKQSTLYNYVNKYANIKTQMATEFVIQTLREKGGKDPEDNREPLSETLKELFRRFFPGKEFEGVKTNEKGELEFAVTVGDGQKHDINDLSSGEKEILFGYLRLRNSAQRQSIILLDEPELHLNPKLIRGLPQFYQKYIGEDLDNQIWTVTHSDAFLREAIGSPGTRVYHMKEVNTEEEGINQVHEITREEESEEAILELIGDIAGYRPGGKIVIFEGEDSEFDVKMTGRLFPQYERRMNFVSGGNRSTVRRLHQALEKQEGEGGKGRIFSIVDKDGTAAENDEEESGRFTWNVYHIENYLLDARVIFEVLEKSTISGTGFSSYEEVNVQLREIAIEQVEDLVEHSVRESAHKAIGDSIRLKGVPKNGEGVAERVSRRVAEAIERLAEESRRNLSREQLDKIASERRESLETAMKNERWKDEFRGREILSRFANKHTSMRYETMRDMIINTMAENGIQPLGMLNVLKKIDKWGM